MADLRWLPTSPFPRDPLYPANIYAGGGGPQLNNLDQEDDYHPFKVYVMELESNGSTANGKVGMEYKSTVFKNENGFGFQPIVGLLTDRLDFDDPGWTGFPTQEKIVYLEGTVSGGNVTQIDVNWDLDVNQLSTKKRLEGGSPVTPENQTKFFLPIARLFRYGSEPQKLGVEQYVKTHLLLYKVTFDKDTGWYPVPGPGGGAVSRLSPWDITLTGIGQPNNDGKYNSYKAIVNPGLVGGILPSNWQTEFTVGSGLQYMLVTCQTNGKVVTGASISTASSPPDQQTPTLNTAPSSFKVLFGVVKDGSSSRTVRDGHIAVNPVISLSLQKPSPTPGLNVVDRYYVWGLL